MPALPEGPSSKRRASAVTGLQRAAKQRRLMCGSSSDGASNWEPGAPPSCLKRAKAARQAKHASAALESSEASAISAHRTAQRQYLRRKKVTMTLSCAFGSRNGCGLLRSSNCPGPLSAQSKCQDSRKRACFSTPQQTGHDPACGVAQGKAAAVHARVPALRARLGELQAELTQLLDRHHALTEVLPWATQLVRASLFRFHMQACGFSCCVQAWFHLPFHTGTLQPRPRVFTRTCSGCHLWR